MEIAKLSKLITPSGTMAISNKARVLREQGKPVIGFGAGEPDFPTPEYVIKDVQVAAEDTSNHKYSPVAGLTILKEEIVRTSELYSGININQENVLVSNGGKHAILTTFMSILNPGDEVLIPSPYWTTYPEAVKISGGNPVIVDTEFGDDFKINTDQLDALKTSRTKVLVWVSPSNPTGVVYTKEEAEKIAKEQLVHVGLGDKFDEFPTRMSGGQQQRLAIARALAMEPEYMLFDEITSALDPELVGEVLDTLRLLRKEGMTMICVTHEIAFAREVSDRVAFFHKGVIEEIGTPEEVIGNPQKERTQQFLSKVLH